jgi:hypothetical protein
MKIILPLLTCILTGCGARVATMQYQDLNHFVVDCQLADQQHRLLKMQYNNTNYFDTRQRAVISQAIREISVYCRSQPSRRADCLTVQEQFSDVPATSVVCRVPGRTQPVVNTWRTEIDK